MSSAAPSSLGERSDNTSSSTIDRRCGSLRAEWITALLRSEGVRALEDASTSIATILVDSYSLVNPPETTLEDHRIHAESTFEGQKPCVKSISPCDCDRIATSLS